MRQAVASMLFRGMHCRLSCLPPGGENLPSTWRWNDVTQIIVYGLGSLNSHPAPRFGKQFLCAMLCDPMCENYADIHNAPTPLETGI